jgi:hypothetical protein
MIEIPNSLFEFIDLNSPKSYIDQLVELINQKNSKKIENIISKLNDQNLIFQILSQPIKIRQNQIKLLRKISDIDLLSKLIKTSNYRELQLIGLQKFNDNDDLMIDLILDESNHFDVKFQALEKINNIKTLHRVALEAQDLTIRKLAVSRTKEPEILMQIISRERSDRIRRVALQNIPILFQTAIAEIAVNDSFYFVKELAVDKLFDNELLFKVATEVKSTDIIRIAVSKINDINILISLLLILPQEIRPELDKTIAKLRNRR